jgi:DNA-binding IclR family transcriptional regulator
MSDESRERMARGSGPAPVQSLARGLDILGQFTARDPELSLAELSRRSGLHAATVYRFVKTLQAKGFLTHDAVTGMYGIGPAWALSLYSLGKSSVVTQILEQDLVKLAEATGEGAAFSVRTGDLLRFVNVVPASSGFAGVIPSNRTWRLTETWNPHVRVHLAAADEETRKRVLALPAVRYTEHTVTDPAAMAALLEKTAAEGIAYGCEERSPGRAAVAVPIFSRGSVAAAVGLHIPPERFNEDHLPRYVHELRAAAAEMGRKLDEGQARFT